MNELEKDSVGPKNKISWKEDHAPPPASICSSCKEWILLYLFAFQSTYHHTAEQYEHPRNYRHTTMSNIQTTFRALYQLKI